MSVEVIDSIRLVEIGVRIVVVHFISYCLLGRSDSVVEFPLLASVFVADVTSFDEIGIEQGFEVGTVVSKNRCCRPEVRLLLSSFENELDVVRFGLEMVSCAKVQNHMSVILFSHQTIRPLEHSQEKFRAAARPLDLGSEAAGASAESLMGKNESRARNECSSVQSSVRPFGRVVPSRSWLETTRLRARLAVLGHNR